MKRGRSRHQKGYVKAGFRPGTWQLHWFPYVIDETGKEKRLHKQETILASRKYEAEEELRKRVEKINPLTSKQAQKKDDSITLEWFITHRWKPLYEGNWRENSKVTNETHLKHITRQFGATPLKQLDGVAFTIWLTELAKKYSASLVLKCRTMLKSICSEAVEQDYLVKDPARQLTRQRRNNLILRRSDKTVLEWSHYPTMMSLLTSDRDRLVVKVAACCGVRPEELFAFRWESLEKKQIAGQDRWVLNIKETVHRGTIRAFGKTAGSLDYVALPDSLAGELLAFRNDSSFAGDRDYIFTNTFGRPVHADHFCEHVLGAVKTAMGLKALNFRILRRSFATRSIDGRKGTTKDVQRQLRHASPDMTLEKYAMSVEASVFDLVDEFYSEMMGKPTGGIQ